MRQRFSQDKLPSKQNSSSKLLAKNREADQTLTNRIFSAFVTMAFFPAYVAYSGTKTAISLPFMPFLWILKKLVPNLVDDISTKKLKFQQTVKDTADASFMTLSSVIAK